MFYLCLFWQKSCRFPELYIVCVVGTIQGWLWKSVNASLAIIPINRFYKQEYIVAQ